MLRTTAVRKSNNPKLILLTGSAGSGKTRFCLNELAQVLNDSKSRLSSDVLYILPNAEHRERVTDLLLRQSIPGFFGNVISTFDEILDSLLRFGEIEFASDITRQLILKEICNASELSYFREAAKTRGFVELILGTISELKESLIGTNDFEKITTQLKTQFPHFSEKYDDISLIYSKYEKRLSELQLRDRHDALFLLEEKLKSGTFNVNRFQFKQVWIDGFFDFSNLQLSFIRLLAAHSDQITITLTYEPNSKRKHLFLIASETRNTILKIGFRDQALPKKTYRFQNEILNHVEENVFSDGSIKIDSGNSAVTILDATGIAGELEMIAREIKRIASISKINFSDIALLFRNVNPYAGALRSVFAHYGIPIEVHEREELRFNPLAKAFASLIKILVNGWAREDVFNFLKSGYIKLDREFVWEFERAALREGILNGRDHWLKRFPVAPFTALNEIDQKLSAASGALEIANILRQSIKSLGLSNLDTKLTDENQKDFAALKRLDGLFLEICRKHKDESVNFKWFSEILLRLIDIDLFAFHSRDKNKVQIYNVSLARQKEYRIVFIPGLLEKNFPIQIKEDPILSDSERQAANQSETIFRERLPRQSLEKFFFYLAVTRASEKLYLSYPRFDLEGKEALPSFYVEEVRKLFSNEIPCQQESIGDLFPKPEQIVTEKDAAAHTIHYLWHRDERKSLYEREASAIYYNQFRSADWFQRMSKSLLSPAESGLKDARIKEILVNQNQIMTASRLETYAQCSYRFFADYELQLQEEEDQIDSKVVGTIMHDVLQYLHEWLKAAGKISIEEIKAKCRELLQNAFEKNPLTGDYGYRIAIQKGRIEDMLLRVIDLEIAKGKLPMEKLVPQYFEYEFGSNNDFLVIEKDGRSVQIRGKIDRIDTDLSKTYGLVIDYKTGKKFKSRALIDGTQLQLPIYILAMKQKLGLKPLGGHLYSLSQTVSSGFHHKNYLQELEIRKNAKTLWGSEDWDQLFDQIETRILNHTEEIRSGKIEVRPRECADFCPYSSVCRIEKWRLESIYREMSKEDQIQYHTEKIK